MGKTKLCTSGFLIVFLMFFTISLFQPDSSTTYNKSINLSAGDTTDSWSKQIKSGAQLYSSSMALIDNNTYIIGSIGENYYTSHDIYIAKFDSSGVKLWEQTWDSSEYDHFKGYIVDSELNIYIVGTTNDYYFESTGCIFLLKYNTSGTLLWSKTIDPFSHNYYYDLHSIGIDLNDFIFISSTGYNYTNTKTFTTKVDSSGNIMWTEEIEIGGRPEYLQIQLDSVGNIYQYGEGYNLNLFLLKLNNSGSRQWLYEWGDAEYGFKMKLDLDDNIIMTGISYTLEYSKCEIWIMKLNSSGNLTRKVICKSFEGYNSPRTDVWFLENIFLRLDSSLFAYNYSLDSKWNITFGNHLLLNKSWGFNLCVTSQLEMHLIYYTYGDIIFLKFNSSGVITSHFNWGGSYYIYRPEVRIDSQDNLYMLCSIQYDNIWKETIRLSFLVKNPKSGGEPQLDPQIDERLVFLFSILGVSCVISVILVSTILKPKFRD